MLICSSFRVKCIFVSLLIPSLCLKFRVPDLHYLVTSVCIPLSIQFDWKVVVPCLIYIVWLVNIPFCQYNLLLSWQNTLFCHTQPIYNVVVLLKTWVIYFSWPYLYLHKKHKQRYNQAEGNAPVFSPYLALINIMVILKMLYDYMENQCLYYFPRFIIDHNCLVSTIRFLTSVTFFVYSLEDSFVVSWFTTFLHGTNFLLYLQSSHLLHIIWK